jgi:hypothetical protein
VATYFSSLVDDFSDNSIDTAKWPNKYGLLVEDGNGAGVHCDEEYSAYASGQIYRLTGSHVYCHVTPASGTSATKAYTAMLVRMPDEADAETRIWVGFVIDTATNTLQCIYNEDYWSLDPVVVTYDSTNHAWLQLREASGTLYWETSSDGSSWTTRRSMSTPGWANYEVLGVILEAHRVGGSVNYARFRSFNC